MGAENLIRLADQGRCTRKNVGTYRATYVSHSVAPAVRQDPDGDLEILVSNPIGVFGTHRLDPLTYCCFVNLDLAHEMFDASNEGGLSG